MSLLPHPPDGCPACLTTARIVIAEPSTVRRDGLSLLAEYTCTGCGHQWRCWWDVASLVAPERREVGV